MNALKKMLACLTLAFSLFFFYYSIWIEKRPSSMRLAHFKSPIQIAHTVDSAKSQSLFDMHYKFYEETRSSLYSNIAITLILCVLGVIILLKNEDIEIPGISSMRIPIKIVYLIVPAALGYYWIQFGFLLHDCIGSRIELSNLVKAQMVALGFGANPEVIPFQDYFTYSQINTLKDTGFLDTWFLLFYPNLFPTSEIANFTKALPILTMILVGALYGIGQGFALGLPINWVGRYRDSHLRYKVIVIVLLVWLILLIYSSHLTFYFGGRNPNWLQGPILLLATITMIIITRKDVRDFHLKNA